MIDPILMLLNKILLSNESSQNLLAKHHNKSFCLVFPVFSISAIIDKNGLLDNHKAEDIDSIITIPYSTINYLINQDKLALIKEIDISGDKNFGIFILEVLSKLNWNIIDQDKIPGGRIIISTLSTFFKKLNTQFQLVAGNAINSIKEYLLYETEDLVTSYEMTDFCQAVDELNNRVDILRARINLLLE